MSENVIDWNGLTTLPTDPARVIERAAKAGLTNVVIVGFDSAGAEFFAASDADGANVLWHLERAKHKLLSVPETHFGG